jgi:beta-lactamase class A
VIEPQMAYLNILREVLPANAIVTDELSQVGFASWYGFPVYEPRTGARKGPRRPLPLRDSHRGAARFREQSVGLHSSRKTLTTPDRRGHPMKHSPVRRALLLAAASLPLAGLGTSVPGSAYAETPQDALAALEAGSGGRLGVAALNTADGAWIGHRADERFALCSTFKILAVAALLKRSAAESALLEQRVSYTGDQLVTYSPITEKHVDTGMTVAEICAAALQYSDNTAANLIIELVGGPAAVTAFARSIGDDAFRLDRIETALNSAIPGDPRDTSTPNAMAKTLHGMTLGDLLGKPQRDGLVGWMRGNTTGAKRIRAGVPADYGVADKTGTGSYGTANDVGLVWPPGKPPIVAAIYFTHDDKAAVARDDVLASATKIVIEAFA